MTGLRGVIPIVEPGAPPELTVIQWVMVNWLYYEVDQHIEEVLPLLKRMHGFRNREVRDYVTSTRDDRMREVCLKMYGSCELPQNITFNHPGFKSYLTNIRETWESMHK